MKFSRRSLSSPLLSSAIIFVLLEMGAGGEGGSNEGGEEEATECISHDESITAVNLTALLSLISRREKGLVRVLVRQTSSFRVCAESRCHRDFDNFASCTFPTRSVIQLANSLSLSTELAILNERERGPRDFDRDPLMSGRL